MKAATVARTAKAMNSTAFALGGGELECEWPRALWSASDDRVAKDGSDEQEPHVPHRAYMN